MKHGSDRKPAFGILDIYKNICAILLPYHKFYVSMIMILAVCLE